MKLSNSTLPRVVYSFFMLPLGILLFSSFSYAEGGGQPTAPRISLSSTSVTEGDTARIRISIDKCPTSDMVVNYTTSNGSATAGSDYTAQSGSVTFASGAGCTQSFTVDIPTIDDTQEESDETFNVSAGSASGLVTISDNDAQPSVTVGILKQAQSADGTWE